MKLKFSLRRYLEELCKQQKLFSGEYGIFMDPSFDPRSFLRSFEVEAIRVWPKPENVKIILDDCLNKRCKSINFWFTVYSDPKSPYDFVLKYGEVRNGLFLYPTSYAHHCPYTYAQFISLSLIHI